MLLKRKQGLDITSCPILSGMLLFAIPLILSNIFNRLFNTVDTVMVGRWGGDTVEACEHALAAVGSCGALIATVSALFTGLSTGVSICTARALGAKDSENVRRLISTAITLSSFCGLICASIGFFFAKPLLVAMGTDPSLLDTAAAYMRVYFLGVPATMIYTFCAGILNAKGDTVRPMIFLTLGGVINVLFNALMIMVFHLGAVGVGAATAITQFILLAFMLIHMTRVKDDCRIRWNALGIETGHLKEILRIGIPSGLQGMLLAASNVLAQAAINAFGPAFIAGSTSASSMETYLAVIQSGIASACTVFVSQNIGAKNFPRIKKVLFTGSALAIVVGFLAGLGFFLCAEPIMNLFCPDNPPAIQAGLVRARLLLLMHFFYGLMVFGMAALRGLGKSILPTALMLAGCGVFRMLWIGGYNLFFKGNAAVLFSVYPVSWVLTAIAVYVSLLFVFRSVRKKNETALSTSNQP